MSNYDAIIIGAGHNGLTNARLPCQGRAKRRRTGEERLYRRRGGHSGNA